MVEKKRLPNGKEIWQFQPLPAMAPRALRHSRAGFYGFRLCQGNDIHGQPLFKVQAINIFGFLDDFCLDFTEDFNNKKDAISFYNTAVTEGHHEYNRLREAQQKRIQEG